MHFDEDFLQRYAPEARFVSGSLPNRPFLSVDSRTIKRDEIFVALRGSKVDGHAFLSDAVNAGAAGVIISNKALGLASNFSEVVNPNFLVISSPTPEETIYNIAWGWRREFRGTIAAITGSMGKTSTKEIVANILKDARLPHRVSVGNQNTKLGVALNVCRLSSDHQFGIFEVGISKEGEMRDIVSLLEPTLAAITCVGHGHIAGLGSMAGVLAEKCEIFSRLRENSVGIINGDQPRLAELSYNHPVIKFGSRTSNQIQARRIKRSNGSLVFTLKIYGSPYAIRITDTSPGRVMNSLAAAAIAYQLGIPPGNIVGGICKKLERPHRFERKKIAKYGTGIVIDDSYNSNPESARASLEAFGQMETEGEKIAVIGDMLELGIEAKIWHKQLGKIIGRTDGLTKVILVGKLVSWATSSIPNHLQTELVEDWKIATERLKNIISSKNVLVLVKGSHGVQLEKLVQEFTEEGQPSPCIKTSSKTLFSNQSPRGPRPWIRRGKRAISHT